MAKLVDDLVLDAALDYLSSHATRMTICSSQPTTYTEGNATYSLADVTISGSDFTKANGDSSGRKTTIGAKTGVTVDVTGTATHVALLDVSGTKLLYVTTCTSQAVGAGGTVDFGSWKIEIADPT